MVGTSSSERRLQSQLRHAIIETARRTNSTLQVPEAGHLVWSWFASLHRTRHYGALGPEAICYREILAFVQLHRWPLEPRHIELITCLDEIYLKNLSKVQGGAPQHTSEVLSAANFDAVF